MKKNFPHNHQVRPLYSHFKKGSTLGIIVGSSGQMSSMKTLWTKMATKEPGWGDQDYVKP